MKAVIIENYGSADEFKMVEQEAPRIKSNEVLIEVHAVSVNPFDWKLRAGHFKDVIHMTFPIVFGWDVSGVVKEAGKDVTEFQAGDEVFAKAALKKPGGFAEYMVIEERHLVKKPPSLSFEEAAGIPVAGIAAWQALFDYAELREGEKVLIHAGSGGVGSFAIQFAKHFGATVATTTSGKNIDYVKDLGADFVINYKEEDFADQGAVFDVVLDTLGGAAFEKSYDVLKEGGRLVTLVGEPDEELAKEKGITVTYVNSKANVEQLAIIGDLAAQGKVKIVISEVFPFSEEGVRKAHQLSESGHARGKIIVRVK